MLNPYLELILVSIIFGASGTVIKLLHLPPTTITFFRLSVPTIIVFIYLTYKKVKLFQGNNRLILFASLINAIRLLFFFSAFTLATVGNATIASSVGPVFVFIYSHILLKEKITKLKTILLSTAVLGVILLYINKPFSFSNSDFAGMTFALLSSALYNLTVVLFKKELDRYSKTEVIFYQNVVGTFIFLPFLFLNRPIPTLEQFSYAIVSQFFIGVVAFIMFFSALKKVTPTVASIALFDSIISVMLGVLIFHETLSINMIIGGILIIVSSIMIQREI